MAKTLFVDKMQYINGQLHPLQYTNNIDTIKYNCNQVDPSYLTTVTELLLQEPEEGEQEGSVVLTMPVAKYLCVVNISAATHTYVMGFYDLRNNDDWFYELLTSMGGEHPEVREQFTIAWNGVKANYSEKKLDDFVLQEGSPPV